MREQLVMLGVVSTLLFPVTPSTVQATVFTENYPGAPFSYMNGRGKAFVSRGIYDPSETFTDLIDPTNYTISLLPAHPQFLTAPNAAVNFMSVLAASYPTWNFNYTTNGNDLALSGNPSLTARTYTTFTNDVNDDGSSNTMIGAELFLTNTPAATDPQGASMHWIQVVSNNWSSYKYSGTATGFVDASKSSPFYDVCCDATNLYFDDTPSRPRYGLTNFNGTPLTWLAEVFVAQDMGPDGRGGDNVNIYDGVEWGWQVVPEPSSLLLLSLAGITLLAMHRRRRS